MPVFGTQTTSSASQPIATGPASVTIDLNTTLALTGISATDTNEQPNIGTSTLALSAPAGTFHITPGAGTIRAGTANDTATFQYDGAWNDVVAVASTITYHAPTTAQSINLTVAFYDHTGAFAQLTIPTNVIVGLNPATLAGVGQVIPRATAFHPGSAVIGGHAGLTAIGRIPGANFNGVGTVIATGRVRVAARPSINGVGSFAATATVRAAARLLLAGEGNFTSWVPPTDAPLVITPAPIVVEPIDKYLDLIPAYNAVQPNFIAMLRSTFQPLIDMQQFLTNMPRAFDLDFAIGTQLDQVGIWIGRDRFVSAPITGVYFSWDTDTLGWEEGTWQGTFDPDEGTNRLDDETYRQVLYAKVGSNNWDGTITGIVTVLQELFGSQGVNIVVVDNLDMTMTITITDYITNAIFKALLTGGYIPIKPEGVQVTFNFVDEPPVPFGIGTGRIGIDFIP